MISMMNTTLMAKYYGKKPAEWLRLHATISLLTALAKVRKSDTSENQLVTTVMGSPESGGETWMHQGVAIEFGNYSEHFDTIDAQGIMINHETLYKEYINMQIESLLYSYVFITFGLSMELTEELIYTIARVISNQKLSESEKQAYYVWEMTPMALIGENHVVWLN